MRRTIPILMFHQITPQPAAAFRKYAITPTVFAAQMDWVAQNGFTPVRLEDVFGNTGQRLPDKPIVITFDDGFQDCFDHAVPVLLARGFTATYFIVAGLVGRQSEWLVRERGVRYPIMNWSSIRRLVEQGFECGTHSLTHPRLAELPPDRCYLELRHSRAVLEDHLGRPVAHLAYPFGSFSESVREIAAECGFASACTVTRGIASDDDDPLTLPRVPVNGTDAPLAFAREIQEALDLALRPGGSRDAGVTR